MAWTGLTGKNLGDPFTASLNDPRAVDPKGNHSFCFQEKGVLIMITQASGYCVVTEQAGNTRDEIK